MLQKVATAPPGHAARPVSTRAYLTIRNLSGRPDELTGARRPAARRVTLPPGNRDRAGHAMNQSLLQFVVLMGQPELRKAKRHDMLLMFRPSVPVSDQ